MHMIVQHKDVGIKAKGMKVGMFHEGPDPCQSTVCATHKMHPVLRLYYVITYYFCRNQLQYLLY